MKTIPNRIVIYAKDVENITGRKPRTCRTILQKIREYYKKRQTDPVTVKEFSEFMNIKEEQIKDFLAD